MNWEFDHIFLATDQPVECETTLSNRGFDFSHRLVHRGQGTANVCAFFDNVYFEILYEEDVEDIRAPTVSPLSLEERIHWRTSGACPFGICLRPREGTSIEQWPTETWSYQSRHRPPGANLPIVTPQHSMREPMIFLSRNPTPAWRGQSSGVLTSVKLCVPHDVVLSPAIAWCADNLFSIARTDSYRLELGFSGVRLTETDPFDNAVPLLIRETAG